MLPDLNSKSAFIKHFEMIKISDRKIYKTPKVGSAAVFPYCKFIANQTRRKVLIKVRYRASDKDTLKTYKIKIHPDKPNQKTSL